MAKVTVVDLGSGYGVVAELVSSMLRSPFSGLGSVEFERYVAVDVSESLLAHAVERARALGIEAEGHVFNLDTGQGSRPEACTGDVVVLAYVLTHLGRADLGLREAARLAKDGGVVVAIDAAYSGMVAAEDEALVATVASIRGRLRHDDFTHLDRIAQSVGLNRLSGLEDVRQQFGAGQLSPKVDALGFIRHFAASDPARVAWERIEGGVLELTQIRRAYAKGPVPGQRPHAGEPS